MKMSEEPKILCPVCGKCLLEDYDICKVCNWENDPVQLGNPNFSGGANIMSLNEARAAYFRDVAAKTKAEILLSTDEREVFAWLKANGADVEVCDLFNRLVKDENAPDVMIDDLNLIAKVNKLFS